MSTKQQILIIAILSLIIIPKSSSQTLTGYYELNSKHKFTLFGLLPRFYSDGSLIMNNDSTFSSKIYWESFVDEYNGTWKIFNDTILFYDNFVFGDVEKENYAFSASQVDTLSDQIIFQIADNRDTKQANMSLFLYTKKDSLIGRSNQDGTFIFNSTRFDSLIVIGDKYSLENQFKITPICCDKNYYYIILSQRSFIIDKNKIKDFNGNIIFKKKHVP